MGKPDRPSLVTSVAVLQLVVGGLLLACGSCGLLAAVAGTSSATVTITTQGKSTTRVYDTREEMEKEAPGYKNFLVASSLAGVLLDLAMILAAVGLLTLAAWGWWLSLSWALLHLTYQIVALAYLWSVAIPAANRMVYAVPHDDDAVCSGLVNGNTFYHLFWMAFALGLSVFSIVFLGLLALPSARRAFKNDRTAENDEEEGEDTAGEETE